MGAKKIYFDPPLWLQRQSWVLSHLRKERVDSVLDVGCSNGMLLSALLQPAFQVDDFPVERFPALSPVAKNSSVAGHFGWPKGLESSHWIYSPSEIVLSQLAGLDIDSEALEAAKSSLSAHGKAIAESSPRWTSLHVQLLQGGLEVEDERLDEFDAFVSTEVIEHLDSTCLQQYAPTLLGKYRPRLFLITTPNYSFNAHFGSELSTRPGYPDPTGRTERVFRHADHKFEWTPAEFKQWCEEVADDYGYEVTIQGLGEGIYGNGAKKEGVDSASVSTASESGNSSPAIAQNGSGSDAAAKPRRTRTGDDEDENLRFASQGAIFRRHSAASHSHSNDYRNSKRSPRRSEYVASLLGVGTSLSRGCSRNVHNSSLRDEVSDDGERSSRSRREARSRKPEKLPFLSSPQISYSEQNGSGATGSPVLSQVTGMVSAETQGHAVVWEHTYGATQVYDEPVSAKNNPKRRISSPIMTADEIQSAVLAKVYDCFAVSELGDFVAKGGPALQGNGHRSEGKQEIAVKLWDIWSSREVRTACGGRITALLDALRLVAPHEDEATASSAGVKDPLVTIVGSDGRDWELQVKADDTSSLELHDGSPCQTQADLYLAYQGFMVEEWKRLISLAKAALPRGYGISKKVSDPSPIPPSWD
ncbi:hypothetical protein IE53DRAFT_25937 [Violaceomyces palustris]|uniref:Uncharacterized protein n=1 Tax=Violaceomyces palustris TaxID=1673888 RepID=A0ACD0P237_9BASI|nr:hypothetical protein IE53DRAFT_25937 [Violaceomyces palustris]